jgi:hypothetical protein
MFASPAISLMPHLQEEEKKLKEARDKLKGGKK